MINCIKCCAQIRQNKDNGISILHSLTYYLSLYVRLFRNVVLSKTRLEIIK